MQAPSFKLALTVVAHRDPEQLALLLSALQHPRVRIYLHIDARADVTGFRTALAAHQIGDVTWLTRRRTRWGGIQLVDVELEALERSAADGCQYFVLVSGQDFPLRPIGEIVDFYVSNLSRSFVDHTPLPSDRYPLGGRERTDFYTYTLFGRRETYFPRDSLPVTLSGRGKLLNAVLRVWSAPRPSRNFPSYLKPFGGELWVNLNRDAIRFALDFLAQHPDYRHYHRHTLIPDELFLPSILAGTPFATEHELVNDDLRFIVWSEPRGNHPEFLTGNDAAAMLASADMFARKVSIPESGTLVDELTRRMQHVG